MKLRNSNTCSLNQSHRLSPLFSLQKDSDQAFRIWMKPTKNSKQIRGMRQPRADETIDNSKNDAMKNDAMETMNHEHNLTNDDKTNSTETTPTQNNNTDFLVVSFKKQRTIRQVSNNNAAKSVKPAPIPQVVDTWHYPHN